METYVSAQIDCFRILDDRTIQDSSSDSLSNALNFLLKWKNNFLLDKILENQFGKSNLLFLMGKLTK